MNNKYKNYHPLRVFSWSHEEEKTTEQLLVENTVMEWYASKHRKVSEDEINFINSIEIQK